MLRPLTAALCLVPLVAQPAELFRFTAMGCGPYSPEDEVALARYVAQENGEPPVERSAFVVHLGDLCSGADAGAGKIDDAYFARIAGLLTGGNRIPTYVVPGDNEWNDCPDPDASWTAWMKHIDPISRRVEAPWETRRQAGRPENFAFTVEGVACIGINLVGGRVHDAEEWARRIEDDLGWVRSELSRNPSAAVLFCQANLDQVKEGESEKRALFEKFFAGLSSSVDAFARPVLLLHADGHKWLDEPAYRGVGHLRRVQVDRVEPKFPPVQVTVGESEGVVTFGFDRRLEER